MKNQENLNDQQQHKQEQEQEQETQQEQEQEEQNHANSNPPLPTMNSSPPPKSPPSPPPLDSPPLFTLSSYQTSYSHVFSPPEVKPPKSASPPPPAEAVPVTKIGSKAQDEEVVTQVEQGGGPIGAGGVSGKRFRPNLSNLRSAKRESIKRRALLGSRILGFVFCLVSFSVMAADKNQGWALDSFYRYKEFRYCMSVNVIGFVYSGLQSFELAYSLTTGKHVFWNQLRCYLDFSVDQILTYLLLSSSSSAAFRVEDWEANWGKDEFPTMARASVTFSFLAFVAFALSSLLSGYTLFTPRFT